MASKSSPYPPSAQRRDPSTSGKDEGKKTVPPAGGEDKTAPLQKDDPHFAPESGDKPETDQRR